MRAPLLALALLAVSSPLWSVDAAAAGDDGTSFVFSDKAQVVVFTNRTIAEGAPFRAIADQDEDGTVTEAERSDFEMEVARDADQRDMAEPGLWLEGKPPRGVATSLLAISGLQGAADAAGPISIYSVSSVYFPSPDGATWTFTRNHTDGDTGRHVHVMAPPGHAVRSHAGLGEARSVGADTGAEGLLVEGEDVAVTFGRQEQQASALAGGIVVAVVALAGLGSARR